MPAYTAATAVPTATDPALPETGQHVAQTSDTAKGTAGQAAGDVGDSSLIAFAFSPDNGMVDNIVANVGLLATTGGEFLRFGIVSGEFTAAVAIPAFGSINWALDAGGNPAYQDVPVAAVGNGNNSELTTVLFGNTRVFNGSRYSIVVVAVNAAKTAYGTTRFALGSTGAPAYVGARRPTWLRNQTG